MLCKVKHKYDKVTPNVLHRYAIYHILAAYNAKHSWPRSIKFNLFGREASLRQTCKDSKGMIYATTTRSVFPILIKHRFFTGRHNTIGKICKLWFSFVTVSETKAEAVLTSRANFKESVVYCTERCWDYDEMEVSVKQNRRQLFFSTQYGLNFKRGGKHGKNHKRAVFIDETY